MVNPLPVLPTLRRSLGLVLVSALTVVAASCAGDTDDSQAVPAVSAPPAAPADHAVQSALESAFPAQADRVLGRLRDDGFVAIDGGFARSPSSSIVMHVDVQLPRAGSDVA